MSNSSNSQPKKKLQVKMAAQLVEAREKKKIRLEQAEHETKIKRNVLQKFEVGDVDLTNTYEKGLLIAYVNYLGLNSKQLIQPQTQVKRRIKRTPNKKDNQLILGQRSKKSIVASSSAKTTFALSFIALAFSGVAVLVFFFFAAPRLQIYNLPDQLQTEQSSIIIEGSTGSGSDVLINATPIPVTPEGEFTQLVFLNPGINTITIEAENSLSRRAKVEKIIIANYDRFD